MATTPLRPETPKEQPTSTTTARNHLLLRSRRQDREAHARQVASIRQRRGRQRTGRGGR